MRSLTVDVLRKAAEYVKNGGIRCDTAKESGKKYVTFDGLLPVRCRVAAANPAKVKNPGDFMVYVTAEGFDVFPKKSRFPAAQLTGMVKENGSTFLFSTTEDQMKVDLRARVQRIVEKYAAIGQSEEISTQILDDLANALSQTR